MESFLAWLKLAGTALGAAILGLLGGWDDALQALIVLTVLDYVGGVLEALVKRKLSSAIGYRGIIRKAYAFLIIMGVAALERTALPEFPPLAHTAVTVWFCINEAISILEHAKALGTAVPTVLTDLLGKLRASYDQKLPGIGTPTEANSSNDTSTRSEAER